MKQRFCDFCKREILNDYHKLTKVEHIDKKIVMNHSGDMCIQCYDNSMMECKRDDANGTD